MFKGRSILLLSTAVLLAACQGNSQSESGPTNTDINSLQPGTICPTGSTLTISGVEIDVDIYDANNNGCLEPNELTIAESYVNQRNQQNIQTVEQSGSNSDSSLSSVSSLTVIGNSEVVDGKAQLHTNMDSGEFYIRIKTNIGYNSSEKLRVFFDDSSYAGLSGSPTPIGLSIKPPLTGDSTIGLTCVYSSDFSVLCHTIVAYRTNRLEDGVYSLTNTTPFSLNWTFSSQSLPQSGQVIATYCEEGASIADEACFRNYAEVPVSFN